MLANLPLIFDLGTQFAERQIVPLAREITTDRSPDYEEKRVFICWHGSIVSSLVFLLKGEGDTMISIVQRNNPFISES